MKSLRQLAVASLALQCVEHVERLDSQHIQQLVDLIRAEKMTASFPAVYTLPREMILSFAAECEKLSEGAGFVISAALSAYLSTISFRRKAALPGDILNIASRCLAAGLLELNVSGFGVNDDFLLSLSESPAAGTLKTLVARKNLITDQSASVWSKFTSIEEVNLSNSLFFGEKTLDALSRLPTIRSLHAFVPDASGVLNPKLLETILAPDRMPLLSALSLHVNFPTGAEPAELLCKLFQKRQNRELIEEIDLVNETHISDASILLHRLCPRMTRPYGDTIPLSWALGEEIAPFFSNIRCASLRLEPSDIPLIPQIASLFPVVEDLTIFGPPESTWDFSVHSNLEKLNLRCSGTITVSKWPQTLRELSIQTVDGAVTHVDQFVESILSSLPDLEMLKLNFSVGTIKRHHVEDILRRLTALKTVEFDLEVADPTVEPPIIVSHPNLLELPKTVEGGFQFLPSSLPSLSKIFIKTERDFADWNRLFPISYAMISSVTSIFWPHKLPIDNAAPFLASFAHPQIHLRKLFINLPSSNLISAISNIKRLRKLQLYEAVLSVEEAKSMVASLDHLHQLDFSIEIPPTDTESLEWLRHPCLFHLRLSLHVSPETTLNLNFDHQTLPMLGKFQLIVKPCLQLNFTVASLPLTEFMMTTMGEIPSNLSLSFDDCRLLENLWIFRAKLRKLRLSPDAPFLGTLVLTYVSCEDDPSTIQIPSHLPWLHAFNIVATRNHPNFKNLFRLVESSPLSPIFAQRRVEKYFAATDERIEYY